MLKIVVVLLVNDEKDTDKNNEAIPRIICLLKGNLLYHFLFPSFVKPSRFYIKNHRLNDNLSIMIETRHVR